jgi:integrase
MAVYKRGGVYWYEFLFGGERIRESTRQGNQNTARTMEAAHRTNLAKGEVGIRKRTATPILKEFAKPFEQHVETEYANKPETVRFYKEKLRRLLADPEIASTRLEAIDRAAIDGYKQRRTKQVSRYGRLMLPASVNRELATLGLMLSLAVDWNILTGRPKIRKLPGERNREFVVSHKLEPKYLEGCPQPLKDVALLSLDTGLRVGEAVGLRWPDVHLQPAIRAKFGYIHIRGGKSPNAKRNLSLTPRVADMLKARKAAGKSAWVFPGDTPEAAILVSSLDHQHEDVRDALKLDREFVIHSFRHTMLTRLGESGADAFTIMRIAGHASVTTSQRYVHPTPESMERAFERLQDLNSTKFEAEEVEAKAAAASGGPPTISTTAISRRSRKSLQAVNIKRTGP